MTSHSFEPFSSDPHARPFRCLLDSIVDREESPANDGAAVPDGMPTADVSARDEPARAVRYSAREAQLERVGFVLECAEFLRGRGDYEAAEQLFRVARRIDPGATALVAHAAFLVDRGTLHAAERLVRPLVDQARRTADWLLYASATYLLARIHLMRGETAAARCWLQQSIAGESRAAEARLQCVDGCVAVRSAAAEDSELQRKAAELSLAAECALQEGDRRDAAAFARAAVAIERARGDDAREAVDWSILARVALCEGDVDEAMRNVGEALRRQQRGSDPIGKANSLCTLAAVVVAAGQLLTAERILGRAAKAYRDAAMPEQAVWVGAMRRRLRHWIAFRRHDPACN